MSKISFYFTGEHQESHRLIHTVIVIAKLWLWLLPCRSFYKCALSLFFFSYSRLLARSFSSTHTQNTQPLFVFTRILCSWPFIISLSLSGVYVRIFLSSFCIFAIDLAKQNDMGERKNEIASKSECEGEESNWIRLYVIIVWITMNWEDNSKQTKNSLNSILNTYAKIAKVVKQTIKNELNSNFFFVVVVWYICLAIVGHTICTTTIPTFMDKSFLWLCFYLFFC